MTGHAFAQCGADGDTAAVSVSVALVVAWAVLTAISAVFFLHATVTLVHRCPQLEGTRPIPWRG
jgi:hypothetical protein